MKKLHGFTLIELLIVVAIIAILAAIAVPNFLEAQVRSKVSRVKADQRSMATALEAYYVDNNLYPDHAGGSDLVGTSADSMTDAANGDDTLPSRTFRLINADAPNLGTLTTPVAFITQYFSDPFADTRGRTFRYFQKRQGWILGSFGPDADELLDGDLGWGVGTWSISDTDAANSIETIYDITITQPSELLLTAGTYDPTNGTVSSGDVWRVKE